MPEIFTLHFKRGADQVYQWTGTCLKEFAEDGTLKRETVMSTAGRKSENAWFIPDTTGSKMDSVRLIALAFVRIAQWKYVRIADAPPEEITLFKDDSRSQLATRFFNLRRSISKDTKKTNRAQWLQEMFPLPNGPNERTLFGRWFHLSGKEQQMIATCIVHSLSPASVTVTIDGEEASEVELDRLETFLSFALNAGLPFHFELDGITVSGRPPSIQPGWYVQAQEAYEAEQIYCAGEGSILAILGDTMTAKTVFASYWLRRLIGSKKIRQKLVFCWSFERQNSARRIPVPLDNFFEGLAKELDVPFRPSASVNERAVEILKGLTKKPTLLFLDGLEASFYVPTLHDPPTVRAEVPAELIVLFKGIAETKHSFLLATSQEEFISPFGLSPDATHRLYLGKMPYDEARQLDDYDTSLADKVSSPSKNLAERREAHSASNESVIAKDLTRSLLAISGCRSKEELVEWRKRKRLSAVPPSIHLAKPTSRPLDAATLEDWNLVLSELKDTDAEILLHILSVCDFPLAEDTLLAVAAKLQIQKLYNRDKVPSEDDWRRGLKKLVSCSLLEQAEQQSSYSLHGWKRRTLAESFEKRHLSAWVAINKELGEHLLANASKKPMTRAEILPLVHAGIYLCQAGEKRRAYTEIGYKRLSQGLKGHTISYLGEYQSTRSLSYALLGDEGELSISELHRDEIALILHANALCLRYSNELKEAFREENRAWEQAKVSKVPGAILPIGFNLLRLCHIFGKLSDANEVEHRIMRLVFKQTAREQIAKFVSVIIGKKFTLTEVLDPPDIVDGASALSSMLALTQLYRGAGIGMVDYTLNSGSNACRDQKADFQFLMPTWGRPWHALALLEMGQWQICEKAITERAGEEWKTDIIRYQQTGFFELLAAKTYLMKAKTLKGSDSKKALVSAKDYATQALDKTKAGAYRWWETMSLLVMGQIATAENESGAARELLVSATTLSEDCGFRLLTVDAQLALAELEYGAENHSRCQHHAQNALKLSRTIDYRLRLSAIQEFTK